AIDNWGSSSVSVLLGNGSGGFGGATNFPVPSNPHFVVAEDFNLDGNMDLATVSESQNNASVILGNGAGGFGSATNFPVGTYPRAAAVGDFNLDARADIVA